MAGAERTEVLAYLALGANLGDARASLRGATLGIAALPGTRLVATSSLYRTAPLDATGPDYLNAVIAVATRLNAPELLVRLQQIEGQAGRERPYRNAPRTLDLDILLYGDASISSTALQVPHPRMAQRAFVLVPLAEIAPARVSPAQILEVAGQVIERLAAPWH
ncbi:MAG: 2-amino-4-hydroxy-6-hydroxymethyldihydropteridine diphosphokinase [Polaromonas sp.]|nr:2-amino-4-hydroxy-6-hydroxymethyldihydropteridine diphosphokinase [Polaromonas sp.]